jgi:CAAX protease family protein
MELKDYYKILGVKQSASRSEIKRAYRMFAMSHHPDVNKDAGSDVRFRDAGEAYEVLTNSRKRAAYDQLHKAAEVFEATPSRDREFQASPGSQAKAFKQEFLLPGKERAYSLFSGPPAYVPRSGWPAWAALPAAVVIFVLSLLFGILAMVAFGSVTGEPLFEHPTTSAGQEQMSAQMSVLISTLQISVIVLTVLAAGFYSSNRREVLALRPPAGGWKLLPVALLMMFAGGGLWTWFIVTLDPNILAKDLAPFQEMLKGDAKWVFLAVIAIGAPLSEELLFRGFLFSALAKTKLGFVGTTLVTTLLWTALHMGYSIYGLIEVMAIGLFLSWILVRTGSLWMTILCHGIYNSVVAIVLLSMTLPAAG